MLSVTTISLLLLATPGAPADQLDTTLAAKWKARQITPAAASTDAMFLRRVWLDLAGRVPAAAKARTFLDDTRPDKRARLVDELLTGGDFPDYWGLVWTSRLTEKRPIRHNTHDGRVLHEYLRDALRANKSYRSIVTDLLTGQGLQDASGSANFLLRYEARPERLAGAVGKQFMGVTINCAQCHDHMFAHWKQDDFWGLAAFFGRLRRVQGTDDDAGFGILEVRRGDLQQPDPKGKPDEQGKPAMRTITPRLPVANGKKITENRRQALADWLTASGNPYFARHAVNQIWAQLFGTPLVRSLDNLDGLSREDFGDVLDLLATDFTASGHDVKRLVRTLVLSRAYHLSSAETAGASEGQSHLQAKYYARFPIRPLSVDQLQLAMFQATGYRGPEDQQPREDDDGFADRPVENLSENALTLQRSLTLLNGGYVHESVKAGAERVIKKHGEQFGARHVEELFLATQSRCPSADEAAAMLKLVQSTEDRAGLEDAVWALLNSVEFNTNH
jgi:hypothetical protein